MELTLTAAPIAADRTWSSAIVLCGWSRARASTSAAALTAAIEAVMRNTGRLPPPAERAIVVGTQSAVMAEAIEFAAEIRRLGMTVVNPGLFPYTVPNAIAGVAAIQHQCEGPNVTLWNGPRSALDALAYAADLVCARRARLVFVGGFETALSGGVPPDTRATALVACVMTAEVASDTGASPTCQLWSAGFGPSMAENGAILGESPDDVKTVEAMSAEQSLIDLEEAFVHLTATPGAVVMLSAGRTAARVSRIVLAGCARDIARPGATRR